MALIETFARLCGTGQTLTATAVSTNTFDLGSGRTGKTIGGGRLIVARFGVVTVGVEATAGVTIDLDIINCNGSAGTALAPTVLQDTGINLTTNTFTTATAHNLANSTCLVMTSSGAAVPVFSVAYTAGQFLYVRNATATTFQLSYTPGGPIIDVTGTGTAAATATFTEQLATLVTAKAIPLQRFGLNAEGVVELGLPPPPRSLESFAGRYIVARFVPSNTLDTGAVCICDLVSGYGMDGQPRNQIGYVTA